jgi:hypothetical protein
MHEIHDCLTPRELTAIRLREAGMTYREMGELMGYTGARAGKIYQKSCRKRERWLAKNAITKTLLFELIPITNEIKELCK